MADFDATLSGEWTSMGGLKFIIFKAIIVTDTPPKRFFSYGFLMPYWGQQVYSFLFNDYRLMPDCLGTDAR